VVRGDGRVEQEASDNRKILQLYSNSEGFEEEGTRKFAIRDYGASSFQSGLTTMTTRSWLRLL
jgi:hypothetical protein